MIQRTQYLEQLRQLRDKHIIKVITGVRRSGKSVLMSQFKDELLHSGITAKQVFFANFEDATQVRDGNWRTIHDEILSKLDLRKKNYVFLDEIQNIQNWEKIVDSLFVHENIDIYLTGSNAYFLSSEFSTLLSGRQIEIKMLPFSFVEYCTARDIKTPNDATMMEYLRFGGMPQAVEMFQESEALGVEYLTGVYNTVVIKDILTRININDPEIFERVLRYVFDNIGNTFSAKKVSDFLKANYRVVSSRTVEKILAAMTESYILYRAQRFDIRGKEPLKTQQKYYLVDTGFRNVVLARGQQFDSGRMLENVVYIELLRRGCQVWVGRTKQGKEVDFVARSVDGKIIYYQVTETMRGAETRERELSALRQIDDAYEKIVISLDTEENNYEGIQQINAIRWLGES